MNNEDKKFYVLLGAPGVGKGTQGKLIQEKTGYSHLSTGDLLRAEVSGGTELGLKVKSIIDSGELVPDHLIIDIIKHRIETDKVKGFIFDGFPRTIPQAEAFEAMLKDEQAHLDGVILLSLDDEEILRRLEKRREIEGRKDDNSEVQRQRLNVYKEQTEPLISFYKNKNILKEVDSSGSVEEVLQGILNIL